MHNIKELIEIHPDMQSGQPVFSGTRVPVETLFFHLEQGIPLDTFLEDFPSVKREQAIAILEISEKLLTAKNIQQLYETAA